jgi:hypothetical protein
MKDKLNIPRKYNPSYLSKKDRTKQDKNLRKSRRLYKKGVFYSRPKVKTFKSRKSSHLKKAKEMYGVSEINSTKELSKKTHCTRKSLEKIINKGRGAYFSSGSRPNQSAESWGIARLASSLTGGNAAIVDYHILKSGCKSTSKARKLANKTCKKQNKKCI